MAAPPANEFLASEKAFTRYIPADPEGKLQLCMYFWPVKDGVEVKGIVQLIHGHGCYTSHGWLKIPQPGQPPVYEGSWVEALNAGGWSVFGCDNRGAGRSSGMRAYCNRFDEYVDDCMLAARRCKEVDVAGFSDPSLPMFVMGHSMGGCLAVMTALKKKEVYRGAVLVAPMLSLEKVSNTGMNKYLKPLASLANILIPTASIVKVNKNLMYPDIQEQFDKDPLNHIFPTRVRNATEYLRVTTWLMENAAQVDFPFIVFHSENDTMCDVDGSKKLLDRATSQDKQLVLVNQMWHIIPKEPGNEAVLGDILAWLEKRRGKGPAGPEGH